MSAPTASGVAAPGLDQGSSATSFEVEALSGPAWHLVLTGRALPYRGLRLKGGLTVETTYYPGNPVATQQVIGSSEGSTTINGMWKDRFLGIGNVSGGSQPAVLNGQQLLNVWDVVDAVDRFRRLGQQVRVTWGQVIRDGLITSFEVNWIRQTDVEWQMEFTWASQGEAPGPRAGQTTSVGDAADELRDGADAAANAGKDLGINNPALTNSGPVNALQQGTQVISDLQNQAANAIAGAVDFVQGVNGYIQNVYSAADTMFSLAEQGLNAVSSVFDAVRKVAGIFTYVRGQWLALEQSVDARMSVYFYNVQLPPPAPHGVTATPIDSITAGQMTYAEVSARKLRKAARDQRYVAARQQAQAEASAQPAAMLAVFVARQDQDLRRVATQFYGRPDAWADLAAYNGVHASRLTAGQLIFVPQKLPPVSAYGLPRPGVVRA